MTDPPPTFFMALMPARVPSIMAVEFTAKTSFQSSRTTSSTTVRPLAPDIPALFTTMSRRPHLDSAISTASSHASSCVTSWLKKTASGVSSDSRAVAFGRVDVGDDDFSAFAYEDAGACFADAGCAAGYDGDFVLESWCGHRSEPLITLILVICFDLVVS